MKERFIAERGQRLSHAAAGAEQQAAFVRDGDPRHFARCDVTFDLLGEVMDIDHCALDAGLRQSVERVVDERPACDLDQRLWPALGERAHARA